MDRRAWPIRLEILVVVAITAAALLVRVFRLSEIPPGLWLDEAANGVDILDMLSTHTIPIFFARNNGREPLFIYMQAISISLLGPTPFALRLTAALVGTATVTTTYWMVREAFAKDRLPGQWVALWTALFLAFSYWHISLSRIGLRAITLPLLATITFAWFWRAWRKFDEQPKFPWVELVLCGFFLGATLYTYTAARFVPVLLVLVAAVGVIAPGWSATRAKHVALGVGVIAIVAAFVFAPLANYYLTHPGSFWGHAVSVTILNPQLVQESPLVIQARTILRTVAMFGFLKDPSLRHNPAERPVVDILLAFWLAAGLVIAIIRWRTLPYFFAIAWFLILFLPAILTTEGSPHSLRSVGMTIMACLLPVLAMMTAGGWLSARWRFLAHWVPLPFLLFSGITGIRDYFQAFQDMHNFSEPFMVDYQRLSEYIKAHDPGDVLWIMPRHLESEFSDQTLDNLAFYVQGKIPIGAVLVSETSGPLELSELSEQHDKTNLIEVKDWNKYEAAFYELIDPKHLIDFLLRKYGRLVKEIDDPSTGLGYKTYDLPRGTDYRMATAFTSLETSFGGKVKLTDVAYGRTTLTLDEPASALDEKTVPSGHSLWAVLHWQAQTPIDYDLKTSLTLRDEKGHVAGRIDNLLVSDRYPKKVTWEAEEPAGSYHILDTLPAVPPGQYGLYLSVYEDATLQTYPVVDDTGKLLGSEVRLGDVTVTRPLATPVVSPTISLPSDTLLGPDLALIGYDLPEQTVRPGGVLPLTLYWKALTQPAGDYLVGVELRNSAGVPVLQYEAQPTSGTDPTGEWKEGDVWRDWHDVPISATMPAGNYELVVTLSDDKRTVGEASIGAVDVAGRPRLFETPPLALPVAATFGDTVDLLGIVTPPEVQVTAGQAISLTLAWQAQRTPSVDLVRFVHVVDSESRPVAQTDGPPCASECQSSSWLSNEVLVDTVRIDIPAELAPGTYRIVTGWYKPNTFERLPAIDQAGRRSRDDLFVLPMQVTISPNQP